MTITTLILLALALSSDAMCLSVCNSLAYRNYNFKHIFLCAFFFGLFQGIMPFIGAQISSYFFTIISFIDHWIIFGILCLLGFKTILDQLPSKISVPQSDSMAISLILSQAFVTSLDALATGISLLQSPISLPLSCLLISFITFVVCLLVGLLGRKLSTIFSEVAPYFSGLILIIIGAQILISHS